MATFDNMQWTAHGSRESAHSNQPGDILHAARRIINSSGDGLTPMQRYRQATPAVQRAFRDMIEGYNGITPAQLERIFAGTLEPTSSTGANVQPLIQGIHRQYDIGSLEDIRNMTLPQWHAIPRHHRNEIERWLTGSNHAWASELDGVEVSNIVGTNEGVMPPSRPVTQPAAGGGGSSPAPAAPLPPGQLIPPTPPVLPPVVQPPVPSNNPGRENPIPEAVPLQPVVPMRSNFAIDQESNTWNPGEEGESAHETSPMYRGLLQREVRAAPPAVGGNTPFQTAAHIGPQVNYVDIEHNPLNLGGQNIEQLDIMGQELHTAMSDPAKRRHILGQNTEDIQNQAGFPYLIRGPEHEGARGRRNPITGEFTQGRALAENWGKSPARYDYRIQIGHPEYPITQRLEDKLMEARAAFGLPVHGDNDVARAMRYFMYNRFKTPDTNMAFNKSFTHVFFTRPDCNVLNHMEAGGGVADQCMMHTESAMLWRRNPDLFKLLVDSRRIGDTNNFNLLLSNSITSFNIQDENLSTIEAGKTWQQYEMIYGDAYTGRSAGQFECSFIDDRQLSVINYIKFWITYIDNVARGAWIPSYDLTGRGATGGDYQINDSHIFTKTLDYAASAYAFKVGEDGEDILYWTKYYGVFPVNTGAASLSWEANMAPSEVPRPNVTFRYSFKRDMSPISLIEFNRATKIASNKDAEFEQSWNPNYNHTARPYVGAPFIEMCLPRTGITKGGGNLGPYAHRATLRLKFQPGTDSRLNDAMLYRHSMVGAHLPETLQEGS